MKQITVLILAVALANCSKAGNTDPANSTAATYQAVCQLTNAQSATVVCVDFPQASASNQTSCITSEQTQYTPEGVTGAEYYTLSGPGISISCHISNPNLNWLSSCILSDRYIRYYGSIWSGSAPLNDCNARAGSYLPNE
jgi:hypothetical protein